MHSLPPSSYVYVLHFSSLSLIQWYLNGSLLHTGVVYAVSMASSSDSGQYTCEARNTRERDTRTHNLTVEAAGDYTHTHTHTHTCHKEIELVKFVFPEVWPSGHKVMVNDQVWSRSCAQML